MGLSAPKEVRGVRVVFLDILASPCPLHSPKTGLQHFSVGLAPSVVGSEGPSGAWSEGPVITHVSGWVWARGAVGTVGFLFTRFLEMLENLSFLALGHVLTDPTFSIRQAS